MVEIMYKDLLKVYLAALFLAGSVLFVYARWLPYSYSGDDLQYAMVIDTATSERVFYHPTGTMDLRIDGNIPPQAEQRTIPINIRYILEYPSSILFVKLWQKLGWQGDAILPILWLRLAAGVLGLVFFFFALHKMTQKIGISLLASLGLAMTLSFWTYSTHIDQSISMMLVSCIGLLALAHVYHGGKGIIAAAIALGTATFFNFTAAILAAAVVLTVFFLVDSRKLAASSSSVIFSASYVLLVTIVVVGALLWVSQSRTINLDFFKSASFYGHPEYLMDFPRDGIRAALGFAKSQVTFPGYSGSLQALWDQSSTKGQAIILGYYGVILLGMALPVLIFITKMDSFSDSKRSFGITLIAWLGFFSVFNIWWDPGYIKYWLTPLICWWALAGLALAWLKAQRSKGYVWLMGGLIGLVVFSSATNFLSTFLPESRKESNIELSTALSIRETSSPLDVFLSPGSSLDFYIAYFAERDIRSVGLLSYTTGGDKGRIQEVISTALDQRFSNGGNVFVLKPRDVVPSDYDFLMELIDHASLELVGTYPNVKVYRLVQ